MTVKKMQIETATKKVKCLVKIYNCGTGEVLEGCFKGELLTPYQLKHGGCNTTKITDLEPDEPNQDDHNDQEDWQAAIEEAQEGWGTMPGY